MKQSNAERQQTHEFVAEENVNVRQQTQELVFECGAEEWSRQIHCEQAIV